MIVMTVSLCTPVGVVLFAVAMDWLQQRLDARAPTEESGRSGPWHVGSLGGGVVGVCANHAEGGHDDRGEGHSP